MAFYKTQANGDRVLFDEAGLLAYERTVTASTTLRVEDSGITFNIGTDALVMTLPAIVAGNVGMSYRFRNIGADGNNIITVSPAAADGVVGTIANAAADSVASGVADKDIINTKATANIGDWIELTAVAPTQWFITGGVGIWASQS